MSGVATPYAAGQDGPAPIAGGGQPAGNGAAGAVLLSAQGLQVSYGKSAALIDANLELHAGQILTVIGPNGAGKSSLLNALMGNLPANAVTSGRVVAGEEEVSDLPVERRVRRGLALVPESRELFGSMSIEDNLVLGAYLHRRAGRQQRTEGLEHVFGLFPRLKERRRQAAATLSGGERQMLVIGRALMSRPRVLMLDEPSLGLAPKVMNEVFRVIADLRRLGVAVLLVEQNSRAALQVADEAQVLELGETVLRGTAAEVARHPMVIEAYLGRRAKG